MKLRWRRAISIIISLVLVSVAIIGSMKEMPADMASPAPVSVPVVSDNQTALATLETLSVKGRAPKTGYSRDQFGSGWADVSGCSTRNIILNRDMRDVTLNEDCQVVSGTLDDPYTGTMIHFQKTDGDAVQIDHVIALSDAWQKGAQALSKQQRVQLANDPLELLAVEGKANQTKGDGDAATWLPENKAFRCRYIARQIAVKKKYTLWVTAAEKQVMLDILKACPTEPLP